MAVYIKQQSFPVILKFYTHVSDIEATDDVRDELLDCLEVVVSDWAAAIEHEDHIDAIALGAAFFQLHARFDEVVFVTIGTIVLLPEHGLSLDVTRDTVAVVARLEYTAKFPDLDQSGCLSL